MYRLRCFGTMAVEDGDGDELQLRSRKHSALLLYLLAHRGRAFPRARLASLFWDTEPRLARHSLSQALYDIRTTLPGVEFETSTSRVGAGADRVAYDGEEFEEAVKLNELRRAVRVYGGRYAPDVEDVGNPDFTRWLESERQRYRRLAEMVLYRHVRRSDDQAEWGEMCVSALRLLDMNPLSEDAHRALMRGLSLQGDRAAALRHFEGVEDFLERELPDGISRETLDLVERIRRSSPSPVSSPGSRERPPEMIGREEEFEALKHALEELRLGGLGGLVRVRGEAGVGKTRLLEEFRGLAALDGARVLESQCYAAESDVPYGPVVDGLAALAEETAAEDEDGALSYHQLGHLFPDAFGRPGASQDAFAEPDAGRRRLFEEVADLLRRSAAAGPVVWLVEDVHWIDPSSASLLHYVARRLADRSLLAVVTGRIHEDITGAARELLEDEADAGPRVTDVGLETLGREEMVRLVESVLDVEAPAGTAERIHELAGGNPFYALELLRSSESGSVEDPGGGIGAAPRGWITESLKALLERRMRGLAPDARRILETVAVAGRFASPSLISTVSDHSPERIADLAGDLYRRGLLWDADGRLEFHHDITRDFVYGELGGLQRSALHRTVGQVLAAEDREADPGTLARHFKEGGDTARAYEYALEAAKGAERRHAHEEAIKMAEMAVELAPDETAEAETLWVLAKAELAASKFEAARHHLQRLRQLPAGKHSDHTGTALNLARVSLKASQWIEARQWLSEAQKSLEKERSDRKVARKLECLHLQLKASLRANNRAQAESIRDDIKLLSQALHEQAWSTVGQALVAASLGAYELYYESSESACERLSSLPSIDGIPPTIQMTCLHLKGAAQLRLARWDKSRAAFQSALTIARDYNDIIGQITALNNLMCISMDTGRFGNVLEYHQELAQLVPAVPSSSYAASLPGLNLADTLFSQGKYREAIRRYRSSRHWVEEYAGGDCSYAPSIDAGLGLSLLAVEGDKEANAIYKSMTRSNVEPDPLGGVSSRETVAWFQGFMMWRDDPDHAVSMMEDLGRELLASDKTAAYRVKWLTALFSQCLGRSKTRMRSRELYETEPANRLRAIDNTWFIRSSRRWLEATRASSNSSGEVV